MTREAEPDLALSGTLARPDDHTRQDQRNDDDDSLAELHARPLAQNSERSTDRHDAGGVLVPQRPPPSQSSRQHDVVDNPATRAMRIMVLSARHVWPHRA